ncbi:hypothetical protein ACHAWF_005783 [Thalassiosira exigua]
MSPSRLPRLLGALLLAGGDAAARLGPDRRDDGRRPRPAPFLDEGPDRGDPYDGLPYQSLPTPYLGQHVGVSLADLNGDGALDLLFAAGRHWVDRPYVLFNLGPRELDNDRDGDSDEFWGVRFSDAQPLGPPGAYYQIDVASQTRPADDDGDRRSTILLVGGTCHVERPNEFGSCEWGENTPARVLDVLVSKDGCSVDNPNAPCDLRWEQTWEHPNPRGDRNGGFASFRGGEAVVLLGQGGIEIFRQSHDAPDKEGELMSLGYSPVYRHVPSAETDPRSDRARYAGFGAGRSSKLGGVVAAGRRSDYDKPRVDDDGNVAGINKLVSEESSDGDANADPEFRSSSLPASASGGPYEGNPRYSLQSTNYAFADMDGDGTDDLLEATFLYHAQREEGSPFPQNLHLLDDEGNVKETIVVMDDGYRARDDGKRGKDEAEDDMDAGRSVTTGQIFDDSPLPDVVFASAEGVVTVFANLGVDDESGRFRGLEQRYRLSVGTNKCQVRDVAVGRLAEGTGEGKCQIGIVCAVTCGIKVPGKNHVFYVEGEGAACSAEAGADAEMLSVGMPLTAKSVE